MSGVRVLSHIVVVLGAVGPLACASAIVRPSDLPPDPGPPVRPTGDFVLLLADAPEPMADELRSFARGAGQARKASLRSDQTLRDACTEPSEVVLRPSLGRHYFASNAPDRNMSMVYFGAAIVTSPAVPVIAATWPWHAQTVVDGKLEVLLCRDGESQTFGESLIVRSEGKGFVRARTMDEAQLDAAARGLMRELLSQAARVGAIATEAEASIPEAEIPGPWIRVDEFSLEGTVVNYPEPSDVFGLVIAEEIAAELRARGFRAEAVPRGAFAKGHFVVSGRVKLIDVGSRAARYWSRGSGAGAARFGLEGTVEAVDQARSEPFSEERWSVKGIGFGGDSKSAVQWCLREAARGVAAGVGEMIGTSSRSAEVR